jgi:hypothetical protein
MPTDRDIQCGRTRKSKTAPLPPAIVHGDNRDGVEDTRTSRRLMGIRRGGPVIPRRKPILDDRQHLPRAKDLVAITERKKRYALEGRRRAWAETPKPDYVDERHWEIRRRIEVEWETQAAIALDLGVSQPRVSAMYKKSLR